jgi:signal transduction histidine kinase
VCAAALGGDTVVLGVSTEDARERWALLAWALVGGALLGAIIGGAASHRSATWSLAPLTALRDRVRRVDPDAPDPATLDPVAQHGELEDLRTAIVQLVERLGHSLAQAQSFSAEAAHELRTPLALLAGELELLVEAAAAGPDRATLVRLHALVQSLVALVQRLLVLAGPNRLRAEQGEAVDFADVVDAVRTDLPAAFAARLRTDVADDAIVRGDGELLRALVANAVGNAMKFSTDSVDVRVALDGSNLLLDVVDRGPGIPKADRAKVFAPFYRGAAARRGTPGHGIGLALIAHVAAAHGGTARFVDVDRGAHLRITLPSWSRASSVARR